MPRGKEGAERLDLTGKYHGLLARLFRSAEKAADLEYKEFREYWEELLSGHIIIGVKAADEDKRPQVLGILKARVATESIFCLGACRVAGSLSVLLAKEHC